METILFLGGTPSNNIGFEYKIIKGKEQNKHSSDDMAGYIEGDYTVDLDNSWNGFSFVIKKVKAQTKEYFVLLDVRFINPYDSSNNRGAYIAVGMIHPVELTHLKILENFLVFSHDVHRDLKKHQDKNKAFKPDFRLESYEYREDSKPIRKWFEENKHSKRNYDCILDSIGEQLYITMKKPLIECSNSVDGLKKQINDLKQEATNSEQKTRQEVSVLKQEVSSLTSNFASKENELMNIKKELQRREKVKPNNKPGKKDDNNFTKWWDWILYSIVAIALTIIIFILVTNYLFKNKDSNSTNSQSTSPEKQQIYKDSNSTNSQTTSPEKQQTYKDSSSINSQITIPASPSPPSEY